MKKNKSMMTKETMSRQKPKSTAARSNWRVRSDAHQPADLKLKPRPSLKNAANENYNSNILSKQKRVLMKMILEEAGLLLPTTKQGLLDLENEMALKPRNISGNNAKHE